MDSSVPPVVRGEFLYRDTLLVDVGGDGRRHPRASEAEIRTLLNGKAPKDQVAHWYEAQLIHHGLQRSKDKNTAKVRLQQALNAKSLKVPPHISDMETQMRKDYAAAVRRAKSQSKSASTTNAEQSTPKAVKRKNGETASESSKRTKISMNVGDISIDIDHGSTQLSGKKATGAASKNNSKVAGTEKKSKPTETKESTTPKKTKASKGDENSPMAKSKPNTPKTKSTVSEKDGIATSKEAATTKPKSKATPESKVKSEPKVKSVPKAKSEPKVKSEPEVKPEPKGKSEAKVKKEPTLKSASAMKKEPTVKEEGGDFQTQGFDYEQPQERRVTGVYDLYCPQLEKQLPEYANELRMFLCVDGDRIWGGFQLAMKSGVLRIDEINSEQSTFGWRARDEWESGRLSFGRGCFGELEFYGQERIGGIFYNLFIEPITFQGQRRSGPLWCGRSAYSFEQEWNGYVSEAYGR